MKIKSLQISNILSFKYYKNIEEAEKITFDQKFNILIGQNGSGKSTALEVINFIFRRVLFVPYYKNRDLYSKKSTIEVAQKREVLKKVDKFQYYSGFRLNRNYDFEDKTQKIRIVVEIDEIDESNIKFLQENKEKLEGVVGTYSAEQMFSDEEYQKEYVIDIELNSTDSTYKVETTEDVGFIYLKAYNLYKEVIEIHNEENEDSEIRNLTESFALIGSYRNYSTYSPYVSLGGGNTADKQIQQIRSNESSKSTNATESSEPSIFSLVRLRMADECYRLIDGPNDKLACEKAANELDFVKKINEKINIVNLRTEIKLTDKSSWNFTFSFVDTKREREIRDVNSLSAGQKSILHLVFEAYGRGNIHGGLVIIDEPEIHLHYQFQDEYLRVIEKLNQEQGCQYVLVTHSESLINSNTISSVVRLSLDENGYTVVNQPDVSTEQRWLVKILDNKRSTHAFFGSKVVLVEGEDDRYFFRALIDEIDDNLKKGFSQDITVLDIDGNNFNEWKKLFESFGLNVYLITDLDTAYKLYYPEENSPKLCTDELVKEFINSHPDLYTNIDNSYEDKIYVLKRGKLEYYLNLHQKGLTHVIEFCRDKLSDFWKKSDEKVQELKSIWSSIVEEDKESLSG